MKYVIIKDTKNSIDVVKRTNGKVFETEDLKEAEKKAAKYKNGVVIPASSIKYEQIGEEIFFKIDLE